MIYANQFKDKSMLRLSLANLLFREIRHIHLAVLECYKIQK